MLSYVLAEDGLRPMKAADIDDARFLRAVDTEQRAGKGAYRTEHLPWAVWWDVEQHFPGVPLKVLVAKARRLIDRKLMDGCTCGCRGDLELTDAGREQLGTLKF